ncbi:lysylphosphatidylglycerol synthase transmembrane domain-containing protein, partial [Candidatus Halobonum tyrrellensis]
VGWRARDDAGRAAVRVAVAAVAAANRVTGRVLPVDPSRLAARVASFLGGVERVVGNRRCLATCLGLSAAGWTALVAAFWLSMRAVGHPVSVGLAAFVLPVGLLAVAVPLPGGVGGVEAALVGLLVGAGGLPVGGATAGVVLYRVATYWAPMAVGGVVTAALAAESRRRDGPGRGPPEPPNIP